jgi:NADH:ubiquinone oxidoreductase subunit 6 (subunit J)
MIWLFSIILIVLSLLGIINTLISPISKIAVLIFMYAIGGIILTYLDFYYLGLTYIIVYVGAIAIIFLFVVMMIIDRNFIQQQSFLSIYFVILFLGLILPEIIDVNSNILMYLQTDWYIYYNYFTDIHLLSKILFNGYFLFILIIGIILWTILIGILDLNVGDKSL